VVESVVGWNVVQIADEVAVEVERRVGVKMIVEMSRRKTDRGSRLARRMIVLIPLRRWRLAKRIVAASHEAGVVGKIFWR